MPWKPLPKVTPEALADLREQHRGEVRLLVDENAGPEVAEFLSDAFNVKYVAELKLQGRPDEDVFAAAWREKRVIVTHDSDFLDNRRFPPHRTAGIIRIGPGADGRNDEGLRKCLVNALLIARYEATWYIGKKLDFTSEEHVTVQDATGKKRKFRFPLHGDTMEWVDP